METQKKREKGPIAGIAHSNRGQEKRSLSQGT